MFPGWNAEKTINEVAYARINLSNLDWNQPSIAGRFSNEWKGISSEGTKINMYIGSKVNTQPLSLPSISEKVISAFPKQ